MIENKIIDGRAFALQLRERVANQVSRLRLEKNIIPGLAVILVGEDPASEVYVRSKGKQTTEAGMKSLEHKLSDTISEKDLLSLIIKLNKDTEVNGILVQLPLPKHINEEKVLATISPEKDVDGFHVLNVGRLWTGSNSLVPCTPFGCFLLLKDQLGDLSGKRAVIIGRSNIVGKPMAALLLSESCTVTIAHSKTIDLENRCKEADILIAAVGRPLMVKASWIKPGATVIDVGINRIPAPERGIGKTRLVGDVDFENGQNIAGAITPVPGGVGPMTIACLLRNTLIATFRQFRLDAPDI